MSQPEVTIRCLSVEQLEELSARPNIRLVGVMGWDAKAGLQEEFIHVIDTGAEPAPGDRVFVRRLSTGDEYYKEYGKDNFEGVEVIGILYGVYSGPQKPIRHVLENRDPGNFE